jgi:3-phenylpropionate/cinnamic acid dioxygenase small subunit
MTTATASKGMERIEPIPVTGKRIATGSALYNEVLEFIYDEAALLDAQNYDDWGKLLAEDLSYTAPLRITRQGPDRLNTIVRTTLHFDDDYSSIMGRLLRLATKSAWAEDPPSRTRHMIGNLEAELAENGEVGARTAFLVYRSHLETDHQLLSGYREDVLRKVDGGWKVAKRTIVLDANVLLDKNLSVFL